MVLRSTIGSAGSGNSMIGIMIAINKYHPNIAAAQKQAPVATKKLLQLLMLPSERFQKAPVAKPNPIVAETKTRKKTRFVLVEQMRKIRERMQSDSV